MKPLWCAFYRVKDLERKTAPLQDAEKKHAATAAALASDKANLRREVENWKKRVTSLTASFNAVRDISYEKYWRFFNNAQFILCLFKRRVVFSNVEWF